MSVGNVGVVGRLAVITGAVVLAAFSLGACASDTPASAGYPVTRIQRAAIENARTSCHARPTSIEATRSRYRRARTAMMTSDLPPGEFPPGFTRKGYGLDSAVYVVQMRGRFDCPGPFNEPLSSRSVMTQNSRRTDDGDAGLQHLASRLRQPTVSYSGVRRGSRHSDLNQRVAPRRARDSRGSRIKSARHGSRTRKRV